MKKIISILLFACAGALAACDFLDVVPEGQATQEDIFKTSKEARKYLNTLYTYAPNIAAYRYMPDFCAGDDIITATNGQTRYFPYKSMLYNEENASQTYYGLWDATTSSPSGRTNYDMYKGIRYCYIMIDNIDAVPGISPSVADEFKGEAYFLIAYYHWVLLTHYGPVILVRGQLDMGLPEEQVYVARSPFDECVTFIAETYDRAADLLHGYPTRHLGGGQGDEGPAAALCRQSALQRQHGVLRAFPQQRRHAADEPDLQSRKVEVGARRLPGSDHAGRGQRAQALRKPERDCGCNRCRARRDQLPRLLRRTALEHDRVPLGNGRPDRHRALAALRRRAPEAAVQYRRLLHQHRSDVRVRGDVLHAQRPAVGPRPRDHAYRPLCL